MANFDQSYSRLEIYPENLVQKSLYYSGTLQSLREQLTEQSDRLFVTDSEDVRIPFRDMYTGKAAVKHIAFDEDMLIKRLQFPTERPLPPNSADPTNDLVNHPDCRFVFVTAKHGWAALGLHLGMAQRILSYHQVMPDYVDLMLPFGSQSEHIDMSFSTFRSETTLQPSPLPATVLPHLRRSGRQFQICYNLKMVGPETDVRGNLIDGQWRIRQAAIYHQFDVVEGTALWIITRGGDDIKDRIAELTGPNGRAEARKFASSEASLRSSLEIHLLLARWAFEDWHRAIRTLEHNIQKSNMALYTLRREDTSNIGTNFAPEDVQAAQRYLEEASHAKIVLSGNSEVLCAVANYYDDLLNNNDFPLREKNKDDIVRLKRKLNKITQQMSSYMRRLEFIETVLEGRKYIITQNVQEQSTRKMESLSAKSHNEAVAMRIITVVTLLFLPATFVSTFFSTDIVNYEGEGEGGTSTFSQLAMERWLQVTLPLTAVTVGLALAYIRLRNRALKNAPIPNQVLVMKGSVSRVLTDRTLNGPKEPFKPRPVNEEKAIDPGDRV